MNRRRSRADAVAICAVPPLSRVARLRRATQADRATQVAARLRRRHGPARALERGALPLRAGAPRPARRRPSAQQPGDRLRGRSAGSTRRSTTYREALQLAPENRRVEAELRPLRRVLPELPASQSPRRRRQPARERPTPAADGTGRADRSSSRASPSRSPDPPVGAVAPRGAEAPCASPRCPRLLALLCRRAGRGPRSPRPSRSSSSCRCGRKHRPRRPAHDRARRRSSSSAAKGGRRDGSGRALDVQREFERYLVKMLRRETDLKVVESGPVDYPDLRSRACCRATATSGARWASAARPTCCSPAASTSTSRTRAATAPRSTSRPSTAAPTTARCWSSRPASTTTSC